MQKIQRQKRELRKAFRRIIALEPAKLFQQKGDLLRHVVHSKRQTCVRLRIWCANLRIELSQFLRITHLTAHKNEVHQLDKFVLQTGDVFFEQKRYRLLRIRHNFLGKPFVVHDVTAAHHVDPHSGIVGLLNLLPLLCNAHNTGFVYVLRDKPIYFMTECIALLKANLYVCKRRS